MKQKPPRGFFRVHGSSGTSTFTTWYKATGELRPPKKGEHFLSGATIEAWEAYNDQIHPMWIVESVPSPPTRIMHKGFWYRLDGSLRIDKKGGIR